MALCNYLSITVKCHLCKRYLDVVEREVGERGYVLIVLPCPCQEGGEQQVDGMDTSLQSWNVEPTDPNLSSFQ